MPDEFKICTYQLLYDWINKHLKKEFGYNDREILKRHAVLNYTSNEIPRHQLELAQKELDSIIQANMWISANECIKMCSTFNSKIQIPDDKKETLHIVAEVLANAYLNINLNLRQKCCNTYQSIITIIQCLSDKGFLFHEIDKREPHFYHFILTEKDESKKRIIAHYNINKKELNEYVKDFMDKKPMRINGIYVNFQEKNDILITATKLNTDAEIELFKKRYRITKDADFTKNSICKNVTKQFISSKISSQNQTIIESSQPNINLIDNTIEAKNIDIGNKNIQGDQIINYNYGIDESQLKKRFVTREELEAEAAKASKWIDGIMPDFLEVKDKLTHANSTLEKHNQELSKSVLNLTQTNQDLTKSVSDLVSLNPETSIIKDEKTKISNLKSNVTQLIKKGKTQEAIGLLFDEAEKHNWTECINDLTLLFGRFHRLKATKNKATGYNENLIVEHNQIDEALQSLVNDLEI